MLDHSIDNFENIDHYEENLDDEARYGHKVVVFRRSVTAVLDADRNGAAKFQHLLSFIHK